MRRRRMLLSLLPLLSLTGGCASPPEPPPPPDDEPQLVLDLPERVHSSVPLAEFRGRVVTNELAAADVVLLIDLTNTALEESGVDADGDGIVGTNRPWAEMNSRSEVRFQRPAHSWTSDYDDAIVSVELAAARKLVAALAERGCRIGIVTFTGKPRTLAEVGAPQDALEALERLRVEVDRSGTMPRLALRRARRLLQEAPQGPQGVGRRRAVVFMSDGMETNFKQLQLRRDAERTAAELARGGIAVHSLGFGLDEAEDPGIMGRVAAFGGGLYLHVDRPDDALALVAPRLSIAELPVANTRAPDEAARAVRTFPDGSFDGFVPLVPGENAIELEVVLEDGRRARGRRTLYYEPAEEAQAEDAELLSRLRDRTAETALAGESQAGPRSRRTRDLEIEGERKGKGARP